jgi:hypothetical protein
VEVSRLEAEFANPRLSPDERRVLVYRHTNGNDDVWSIDVARGGWSRLISDPSLDEPFRSGEIPTQLGVF